MTLTKSTASYQSFQARMLARKFVMQALYQFDIRGDEVPDSDVVAEEFRDEPDFHKVDRAHFKQLLEGCRTYAEEIENLANQVLEDRVLRQIDPIEKALIKSAIYEMVFLGGSDRNVIIAEAVRLARKFGAENGFRFVNGVLDKIAPGETQLKQADQRDE